MIFTPFDCTLDEAKAGIARTQSRDTMVGKVASQEIRDAFRVNRFGK